MFKNSYHVARLIILALLLFVVGEITWVFYVRPFSDVAEVINSAAPESIRNSNTIRILLEYGYMAAKLFSFVLLFYIVYVFVEVLTGKRNKTRLHAVYIYIASVIDNNRAFLLSLAAPTRIMLFLLIGIRLAITVYNLFQMPYHYDETLNYRNYSGPGIWNALTMYTLPNNHIFQSAVSAFMIKLIPYDPYLPMRLPSVLASVISIYYFFKLCRSLLSEEASITGTAIFSFSYPLFVYSIHARGYGYLILFAVTLLYAAINILKEQNVRKYLVVYVLSIVLGCFTLPTFVYLAVPVGMVLFVFYAHRRRQFFLKEFLLSHVIIAILTYLCYAPVFFKLGHGALEKARVNGIAGLEFTRENIYTHIGDSWKYLTQGLLSPYVAVAILLLCVAYFFSRKALSHKYFIVLICVVIASPYPLIHAQGAIPFPRTWAYMIIPLSLSIAIVVDPLLASSLVQNMEKPVAVAGGLAIVISVVMFEKDHAAYLADYDRDYKVEKFLKLLKPKLPYISTIGRGPGWTWYLSESIDSEGMKDNIYFTSTYLEPDDTTVTQDMIIEERGANLKVPKTYMLMPYDNPYFNVYLRSGL